MDKAITINIPTEILERAKSVAERTNRTMEAVLIDWLDRSAEELPVDALPDADVLALCELQMEPALNDEFGRLQSLNAEGMLEESQRARLDEIMHIYRRGMLRKAEALKVAVERNLRPPLS